MLKAWSGGVDHTGRRDLRRGGEDDETDRSAAVDVEQLQLLPALFVLQLRTEHGVGQYC